MCLQKWHIDALDLILQSKKAEPKFGSNMDKVKNVIKTFTAESES